MQIQGYTIVRPLGEGGMSVVYLAVQEALGRQVAIKVLRRPANDDGSITDRFLNEAQTIARLQHANIVSIFDFGETDDGSFYYCMPLLTEGDLSGYRYHGDEPLKTIVLQVCAGLAHAHRHGIVHRDVKPENILFDPQGHVLIADFGIAYSTRSTDVRVTKEGHTVGSSQHMSPEQARGEPVDARSDLYSLGVVLFEMLAGRPPFDGPDDVSILVAQVTEPVPRLPAEVRHWQPVVNRALAKTPGDRFQSAEEMARAVSAVRKGAFSALPRPRLADRFRWPGHRPWMGIAAALSITLALWIWLTPEQDRPAESPTPVTEPLDVPVLSADALDRDLADGYRLIESGQLLEPAGDNALDRFLEVLTIYPQSPEARAGVDAVIEAVDQSLKMAMDREDPQAVAGALDQLDALSQRPALEADPRLLEMRDWVNRETIDRLQQAVDRRDRAAGEQWLALGTRIDPYHPAYGLLGEGVDDLADPEPMPAAPVRGPFIRVPPIITGAGGRTDSELDHGYAISAREVTVAQYREFAEATGRRGSRCRDPGDPVSVLGNAYWSYPGFTQSDDHPVVCVSHRDAEAFARWMSERTGQRYRLPTSAEWRHAASAGHESNNACRTGNVAGQELDRLLPGRNFECRDGFERTAPVASFEANRLGIQDLKGNVSEWTADCAPAPRNIDKLLSKLRISDRDRCDRRAIRGTSWRDGPTRSMLHHIDYVDQDIGMTTVGIRLVLDLDGETQPTQVD